MNTIMLSISACSLLCIAVSSIVFPIIYLSRMRRYHHEFMNSVSMNDKVKEDREETMK